MSHAVDEKTSSLYEAAMKLPRRERVRLVEQLIESLDGPLPTPARQAEIDAAWSTEIERRVRDVEEGRDELLSEAESADILRRLQAGQRP